MMMDQSCSFRCANRIKEANLTHHLRQAYLRYQLIRVNLRYHKRQVK